MALMKEVMQSWQDAFTVRRVFGDPIEKDGVTVIPVATVSGGGGGGSGSDTETSDAEASGGGFGGTARPTGVFVIRPDGAHWVPALDITMLGLAGIALSGLIAIVLGKALGRRR